MKSDKLTFLLTNDDRPLREQAPLGSILEEQYRYALRQINEYFEELKLENIQTRDSDENGDRKYYESETIQSDTDYNNNIFAFIGDRGSGKTSCMISVADFLISKNSDIDWSLYPRLKNTKFETIDLIDPTYFDETHNLISLFLAKLYKNFRKRTEENEKLARTSYERHPYSEKARNKFIAKFKTTQEHLYHLLGYIKYTDGKDLLEYVDALSASVNLKEDINELVDIYMNYMEQKDTVLILRVDDVDINERHAGEMVETMRKYFIQPNILVLISFKLSQLEDIKYLELSDFYKHDKQTFTPDRLREMVDKYMVKLIPHSHRIFMPQSEDYHGKPLEVKFSNTKKDSKETVTPAPLSFPSVRQAIPQLIFWKTRYLFYNAYAHESYIVPANLRELRQLIKLLVTLPDYRVYGENANGEEIVKETNWNNKDIFKNYFFETWINNHLSADLKDEAKRIINECSYTHMNTLVCDLLYTRYEKILGTKLKPFYPSLADVLKAIRQLEDNLTTPSDIKYLFFIKSLYSIKLYEAYDLMTEDEQRNSSRNADEILIDDDSKHSFYTPYQMLVGNSMFHFGEYVPNNSYTINEDSLVTFMRNCVERFKGLPAARRGRKKKLDELSLRVKWVQLLVLSVNVFDKCTFNIGNLFIHLPYLYSEKSPYLYYEGGEEFFKTVLTAKKRDFTTLSDDFRASTVQHRLNGVDNTFTVQRWQSFCTVRNVEVLEGFLSTTRSGDYTFFNHYEDLRIFLKKACEFEVKSYDRDENGREPYTIHFKFFKKLLDLMAETDKPANATLKQEITTILGVPSDNTSEIEENEQPGTPDTPTPAV